jgi:hypothetical protein
VGGGGGERSPTGTSPPTQAVGVQVASGYMPGDTLSGCCSSVVVPVSLAPSPPFSVSQQTERGLIKIFALLVQNTPNQLIVVETEGVLQETFSCLLLLEQLTASQLSLIDTS